jgi:hypothetical protein
MKTPIYVIKSGFYVRIVTAKAVSVVPSCRQLVVKVTFFNKFLSENDTVVVLDARLRYGDKKSAKSILVKKHRHITGVS